MTMVYFQKNALVYCSQLLKWLSSFSKKKGNIMFVLNFTQCE